MQRYWTSYYPLTGKHYISPHSLIAICILGLLLGPVATFSILRMMSNPSPRIRPKTTCLLSSQSVFAHVKKNWHPLESAPLFACDTGLEIYFEAMHV